MPCVLMCSKNSTFNISGFNSAGGVLISACIQNGGFLLRFLRRRWLIKIKLKHNSATLV